MFGSVIVTALILAAPGPKADPKKAVDLVGEWKVERVTVLGEDGPPPTGSDVFIFDPAGKYFDRDDPSGKLVERGTYIFDPKANPMTIDLEPIGRGGKLKGIFKIDDGTLTVCVTALPKNPRPTAFEPRNNLIDLLFVMKRVKAKE